MGYGILQKETCNTSLDLQNSYRRKLFFLFLCITSLVGFITVWKSTSILAVTSEKPEYDPIQILIKSNKSVYEYVQRIVIQKGKVELRGSEELLGINDLNGHTGQLGERERSDDIRKPCGGHLSWSDRISKSLRRTNVSASKIIMKILPCGYQCIIKIYTYDSFGERKNIGGDFWRVEVKGDSFSMSIPIRDLMDGTYEGTFLILDSGNYHVRCTLEHTACDGLRDPPLSWFIEGSEQGHYQNISILGHQNDFVNESISAPLLMVIAKHPTHITWNIENNLSTNYGYWIGHHFRNLLSKITNIESKKRAFKKYGELMLLGDSIQYRFADSIANTRLCKEISMSCTLIYMWNYKVEEKQLYTVTYDHKDFNETRVLLEIKQNLLNQKMLYSDSILLVNFGVHTLMSLPLHKAKRLFDNWIKLIESLREQYGTGLAKIIWKNTTPPRLEVTKSFKTKSFNSRNFRFFTKHRVKYWNAYTSEQLRKLQIPILDVHALAISSPDDAVPDGVHYKSYVFKLAEEKLLAYLLNMPEMRNE